MNTRAIERIRADLRAAADDAKVPVLQRFFKTRPGQYGEGDVFLGVTVPQSRRVAKVHGSVGLDTVSELLRSQYHEERLVGLLILVHKYDAGEKGVVEFYLRNLQRVNNWDLVDLSAPCILGAHLAVNDRSVLYKLARSDNIWERRIAIVTTLYFIRKNDFADTMRIAEILLGDRHDLIHKATGWMLREVGKRDTATLEKFLGRHCARMPRTMLRYAIERLPDKKKRFYMTAERR
ncbi:MAG TPA: DNA alkylation repair protein [Nitrososphaera sp.]|nr:DNA alkylation repair protein [Nitrososphaera sp.]